IIFNKLDETGRPGKIFSIIKHLGIPPIFLSSGQAVPQDMLAATSGNFWNILNEKMI
ncbi:MAG: flagellar biosynthesis protein FlhF, partial [Candidatus Marinimicrobia bacterium]|nr:flagellar biosynthesis protein FlhF [Candidatus Neomarinimicrobiota bacterium]